MELVEIWINQNGRYDFYFLESTDYVPSHYLAYKNNLCEGVYDTLKECKEYTVDYDNFFGDDTFQFPKDEL